MLWDNVVYNSGVMALSWVLALARTNVAVDMF